MIRYSMTMNWIKISWIHEFETEPVLMYIELNNIGLETRKVEIYKDDSSGFASADNNFGGTSLSSMPIPESDLTKIDPQFIVKFITKNEFNSIWKERTELT
jgi:hypothetical protein